MAAGVGLLYAGRQIAQTRQLAQREVVFRFEERLNDLDFVPDIAQARDFWIVPEAQQHAQWDRWNGFSREKRHRIVHVLNMFEELGVMYVEGQLDKGVATDMLGSTSLNYWDEANWFIRRAQANNDRLYWAWEEMNADMRRRLDVAPGGDWPPVGGLWGAR